jgi:hypothetical protein
MNSINNNQIVKTITNAFTDDLTPLPEIGESMNNVTSSVNTTSSWFNWQTIIIIILILALLGFNIFIYLAKGTSDVAISLQKIFGPLLSFFGLTAINVTNQTIQTAAQGTESVVSSVASASQSVTNKVTKGVESKSDLKGQPVQQQMQENGGNWSNDSLSVALNDASKSLGVQPVDAASSIEGVSGKSGWCYIGEEKGVRTCAKVGVNDTCMSGDIFPSQEICVNPNLRP